MANQNLSWLDDIEIEDLLTGDAQLVYRYCGKDVLKSLWANLPSITIYLSLKGLDEARRRYIRQFFTGSDIKPLAVKLGISEGFIYKAIESDNQKKERKKPGKKDEE